MAEPETVLTEPVPVPASAPARLVPPAAPSLAAPPLAVPDRGPRRPDHVAIIMDGNGRWAAGRRLPRVAGHRAGAQAVRRCIRAAIENDVRWLTLYAFSSENWRRPADEVTDLTALLRHYLRSEIAELHREGVRVRVIGEHERFGPEIRAELDNAERLTASNTRLTLIVALSYGARAEILQAARRIAEAAQAGTLQPDALDEAGFARHLSTDGIPDPDLVIRTSGECRLSNFLLWQSAYAELVFLDVLWPDFEARHLADAIEEFTRRERRYGARPG